MEVIKQYMFMKKGVNENAEANVSCEKPVSAKIDCGEVKEHNPCVPKMKVGVSTVQVSLQTDVSQESSKVASAEENSSGG